MRASTVGPTDYIYTSAMPFALEAEKAVERLMARRAASVEPTSVLKKPFTYSQAYQTGGNGYSAFDYKVIIINLCIEILTRKIDLRSFFMSETSEKNHAN